MPPKPDRKEKPVKGDDAEKMVLDYLRAVNRPYASTDVSANLKNRVTKTEAQKALNSLAEKGFLTVKSYGKQTIFVYNQSQLPVLEPEEMTQLDNQLKVVKSTLDERRKEFKSLQFEIASLETQPKTKELKEAIREVTAGSEVTLTALKTFRGESAAEPMPAKDTVKVDADWDCWRKEWTSRRKVYKELYGMLADYGLTSGSQADFEEEQGIDNDDEEAKAVEAGEFCHPGGHGSTKRKRITSVGTSRKINTGKVQSAGCGNKMMPFRDHRGVLPRFLELLLPSGD
ncbi:hypothetical protein CspeluHIS016_0601720 [Cutaneotrichosporon spelunceum]|uniref:Homologous-pairing protein 2 winged helix domain-containing protein n=1 Tax=Cutaneotrichosporon spelunceum TaxID=1672016 RepID=A0AAD3YD21_9TREE|nr:hypothetical protein CspeluHIS016_0601720 [Cutaneotrichosporon spelunceum]